MVTVMTSRSKRAPKMCLRRGQSLSLESEEAVRMGFFKEVIFKLESRR